jgi:hypothetical protein
MDTVLSSLNYFLFLAYFEDEYPAGEKGLRARLQNVVDNDFAQITYTAAVRNLYFRHVL